MVPVDDVEGLEDRVEDEVFEYEEAGIQPHMIWEREGTREPPVSGLYLVYAEYGWEVALWWEGGPGWRRTGSPEREDHMLNGVQGWFTLPVPAETHFKQTVPIPRLPGDYG
jgi:hypothetical protein